MHCSLSQPVPVAPLHLLSIALYDAGTAASDVAGCALTVLVSPSKSRAGPTRTGNEPAHRIDLREAGRAGAMHVLEAVSSRLVL